MTEPAHTDHRRVARRLGAGVALLLVVAVSNACQPPRPEARDRPVLLVHGWSATGGTDCGSTFNPMVAQMRSEGFTGPSSRSASTTATATAT